MIEEILYTSAPKGLKPGSHGFCTVNSTIGMAQTTAERLEALSGYRHALRSPTPRRAQSRQLLPCHSAAGRPPHTCALTHRQRRTRLHRPLK
ncbi:MAG UNVERIFIED_CONTAM: hypothetical protein LVR18_07650 [Planctomycetaceae bacterium]|jgi:hypothetical protein